MTALKVAVTWYVREKIAKEIDALPVLASQGNPFSNAIAAGAKKKMAADIASLCEEFNRHLDEFDQRTHGLMYGADIQMNQIHSTIDILRSEMIKKID